jgi:hypothetical protein
MATPTPTPPPGMPPQEFVSALWELAKLVITAVLGVVTFILGQIFMKLAEPAVALRGQIGIIKGDLLMYANKAENISTPEDRQKIYRGHAAKLHELSALIVGYDLFARLLSLPRKGLVLEAASQLIGLSNAQVGERRGLGDWYQSRYIEALLGGRALNKAERKALACLHIGVMAGF